MNYIYDLYEPYEGEPEHAIFNNTTHTWSFGYDTRQEAIDHVNVLNNQHT